MHIDILFLLKNPIEIPQMNGLNFLQIHEGEILPNYTIKYHQTIITFDYLIIDHLISLPMMTENKHILTNDSLETSIERIYAIGSINNAKIPIKAQLEIILQAIRHHP